MFYLLRSVAQMLAAGNEGEESEKLLKDSEMLRPCVGLSAVEFVCSVL